MIRRPKSNVFKALTESDANEYVRTQGWDLIPYRDEASLHQQDITSYNIYLFKNLKYGNQVMLKQANPFLFMGKRIWPLSTGRIRYEYDALKLFNQIVPGSAVMALHYDRELDLAAIEGLTNCESVGGYLSMQRVIPASVASSAGKFLAHLFFWTAIDSPASVLTDLDRKAMENSEMKVLAEHMLFEIPYGQYESGSSYLFKARSLRGDHELMREVHRLKRKARDGNQCLIHGNFNAANILVKGHNMRISNPAFAGWGLIGYDLGILFADFLLSSGVYFRQGDYSTYVLDVMDWVWQEFYLEYADLLGEYGQGDLAGIKSCLSAVLQDALGFAGCEMLKRIIVDEHDKTSDVQDINLRVGKALVMYREQLQIMKEVHKFVLRIQKG